MYPCGQGLEDAIEGMADHPEYSISEHQFRGVSVFDANKFIMVIFFLCH